ncbi:MAG: cytochrome c biogenesis protein ResB, partial [Burkholderiales bacterium]|nr:cytochrome c biogenesis protein ResB [Burkholderiales bacterium]
AAVLDIFAARGFDGIDAVLQHSVPTADRSRAAALFSSLLNQAVAQMMADTLASQGDAAALADAMQAYSDIRRLNVDVLPVPMQYRQRNASGLQVTRQWGGAIVIAGFTLLALGVCLLYFVAERRVWVILEADGRHLRVGMAANRPTPTLRAEFDEVVRQLLGGRPLAIRRKR